MDRLTLRFELLKLTYTHGREVPEAVERARQLETYVLQSDPAPAVEASSRSTLKMPQSKGRPDGNLLS